MNLSLRGFLPCLITHLSCGYRDWQLNWIGDWLLCGKSFLRRQFGIRWQDGDGWMSVSGWDG